MSKKSLAIVVVAAVMLGGGAVRASTPSRSTPTGHVRVETVHMRGFFTSCLPGEACGGTSALSVGKVRIPAVDQSADITVTASFEFRTTRPNPASISAYAGTDPTVIHNRRLTPSRYLLDSHGTWTSTSVTFVQRGLHGAGKTYYFQMDGLFKQKVDSDLLTRNLVVVIDVWPAGAH